MNGQETPDVPRWEILSGSFADFFVSDLFRSLIHVSLPLLASMLLLLHLLRVFMHVLADVSLKWRRNPANRFRFRPFSSGDIITVIISNKNCDCALNSALRKKRITSHLGVSKRIRHQGRAKSNASYLLMSSLHSVSARTFW